MKVQQFDDRLLNSAWQEVELEFRTVGEIAPAPGFTNRWKERLAVRKQAEQRRQVAESLTRSVGADVPLLGQVPLDPALVAAGDTGVPLVLSAPDSPAGVELRKIADSLSSRKRGLAGMSLGLDPAGR